MDGKVSTDITGQKLPALSATAAGLMDHLTTGERMKGKTAATVTGVRQAASRSRGRPHRLQEKGLISTIFGHFQNSTSIGQAIFTGNRGVIRNTIKTFLTTVNSCIGTTQQGWSDRPSSVTSRSTQTRPIATKHVLGTSFAVHP